MPTIRLKRLHENATEPRRATVGSFGYDLATIQEERVSPHETRVLSTGLQLAHDLPRADGRGMAMLVLPRSSLPLKYGLILPNAPGLIDADYSGPIGVIVHNLTDELVTVPQATRIAQAVFVEVSLPDVAVGDTADASRTRGGFGSTG